MCFTPKTSQTIIPFSSKVSENELCKRGPLHPSSPSSFWANLMRGPPGSKFELENINTTVCSPERKKLSIFNPMFQNTQLCDFLIYYIPHLPPVLSLLLLFYPPPCYGKRGRL